MELVEAEFVALGLEVYSQNFSALKPVALTSEVWQLWASLEGGRGA